MGEIKIKILNALSIGPVLAEDLFCAYFHPYRELANNGHYERLESAYAQNLRMIEEDNKKKKFNQMVYTLKKQGIISVDGKRKRNRTIQLTGKGAKILEKFLPKKKYEKASEDDFKIIAFDIPEKDRRKRQWLRGVLEEMDFEMIQKSVWAGKAIIPKEFLDDLMDMDIADKIDIFTIDKMGSLERLAIK